MDFHARRRPRRASRLLAGALTLAAFAAPAFAAPVPGAPPAWVAKSDQNTQLLLDSLARFDPEGAGELGVPGLDEQIFDLKPGFHERREAAARKVREELRRRLAAETDPRVRQDLEILIQAGDDDLKGDELGRRYNLPYSNVTQTIFGGLRALLDDQVEPARRPAALVRLRKYTGMAPGTTPLTRLAEDYTRSKLKNARLRGPFKDRIERDLANNQTVVAGIGELFKKYGIAGYEEPYARLKEQLAAYDAFLRKEMLPTRAATTSACRPSSTPTASSRSGIDMPVEELVRRAEVAFKEIQSEMATLAPLVAQREGVRRHRLPGGDPRAEETADHRRRRPPLLPAADQGAGGDHPARGDRQPPRPADEVPGGERGRERGEPRPRTCSRRG